MAVLTRAGESEMSDYLVNRTDRDRPGSAPTNLRVQLEGENDIKLVWGPPSLPNGPIDLYQVEYRYEDHNGIVVTQQYPVTSVKTKIEKLEYYTDYEVSVRACTQTENIEPLCGHEWARESVKTGIGGKFVVIRR